MWPCALACPRLLLLTTAMAFTTCAFAESLVSIDAAALTAYRGSEVAAAAAEATIVRRAGTLMRSATEPKAATKLPPKLPPKPDPKKAGPTPKLDPKAKQKLPVPALLRPTMSAAELKGNVEVVYSIGASNKPERRSRIQAILNTWASRIPPRRLLFVGHEPNETEKLRAHWAVAPQCTDNHNGGACKDAVGLTDAFFDIGANWVVLLGDDNYVVTANLEEALRFHDPMKPMIFAIMGCRGVPECPIGMCGNGGQIFSRGALKKMMKRGKDQFLKDSAELAKKNQMLGDLANCALAKRENVALSDSLWGLHGWHLKHYELQESLISRNPKPLTYHYVSPEDMAFLHSGLKASFLNVASNSSTYLKKYLADRDAYIKRESDARKHLFAASEI